MLCFSIFLLGQAFSSHSFSPSVMTARYKAYLEYLNSEHWAALRKVKLNQQPACEICGSQQNMVVHHVNYRNWTDCSPQDLTSLCCFCHDQLHIALKFYQLRQSAIPDPARMKELIEAYANTPNHDAAQHKKEMRRELRRKKKEERKGKRSQNKSFRRQTKRFIQSCTGRGYNLDSVKILVGQLQGLIKQTEKTNSELAALICEHSAEEVGMPT